MASFWAWLKPKLVWVGLGAGAVLSVVLAVLTLGRSRSRVGKPPKRPVLREVKDVPIPVVTTDFNTDLASAVKDDYDKAKVKPGTQTPDQVADELNAAFK